MISSYFDVLDVEYVYGHNPEMYKELCKLNLPYTSEWCGVDWRKDLPKAHSKVNNRWVGETTFASCYHWEFDRNGTVTITLYNGCLSNGRRTTRRCTFTFNNVPEELLIPHLLEEIDELAKEQEIKEEEQRRHKRYLQIKKNLLAKVRRKILKTNLTF